MDFPVAGRSLQGQPPLPFSIRCILAFSPSQTKMQPGNSGQGGPPLVLPKRQLQVLLLICDGLTGKEIAQRLGISTKTVEFHRAGIYKRLGLKTIAHLVRYAIRMGLIEP
jgi:DNA-binding NarL/FixJ family response regulator